MFPKLKNTSADRLNISRSLAAVSRLDAILQEIAVISKFFEFPTTRRESFTKMLLDKIATDSSYLYVERRLPFTHIPFETGLIFNASNVIIPRMLEGSIPHSQGERLFFSESDKLSPDPDSIVDQIFADSEESLAAESYLFETFLKKCSTKLIFTYPVIDDGGAETTRSSFLDTHQDHKPIDSIDMSSTIESLDSWPKRRDRLIGIEQNRLKGSSKSSCHEGHLTSNTAKRLIKKRFQEQKFSATSLERYASCPFTFFVDKVLGLVAKEEEMPELVPKDRGTILHAVLEHFYKDHLKLFQEYLSTPDLRKEITKTIDNIIDEVFEEYEKIISGVASGLKGKQRELIKIMAMQVVEMEADQSRELSSPLSPFKCEWGFGEDGVADLTIPVKNDIPAMLHGWIDRIDVDRDKSKFLIVDYKTRTSAKSVKQEILSGLKLQLPIYVEAVRRLLLPDAVPLGGLLIDVLVAEKRHGFIKKEFNDVHYTVGRAHSSMTDEVWNQAIAAAMGACSVYVENIRNGIFDVAPKNGCPGYCDYAEICRYYGQGSN